MRKNHIKSLTLLLSALLICGCSNFPEVDEAISEARVDVSKNFEQIGLEQLIIVEPTNDEHNHQLETPITGKLYLLASRKQIENNTFKEEILLNGEEFETVSEGSLEDFNIKLNGETYFSVKMIDVEKITELNIKTTYGKKLYLYFAKDK
ncbi:TPA: hypothetical protein U1B20_001076 [Streptococcus suis]|uniref:hypothetical protein n=1 Tax=Streptococcus suis TaxID=1307 RepID=UPI0004092E71|nr:hypothetical protein [Streptococcus suis]MCO8202980.1 hypothetical protein [Streptococcus suis]HEM3502781.1 hypothetical protein [Streptococcus suis]